MQFFKFNEMSQQTKTTKEIFEGLYQRELNDSEVADMQFNLYGFFKKLYEIDQRIKKHKESNDNNRSSNNTNQAE